MVGELAEEAELGLGEAEHLALLEDDPLVAAQLDVAELGGPRPEVSWSCTRRSRARIRAASSFATTGLVT